MLKRMKNIYINLLLCVFVLYFINICSSCPDICNDDECPLLASCTIFEAVIDDCNCCFVCPNIADTSCGRDVGFCDRKHVCVRNSSRTNTGTCEKYSRRTNCSTVICPKEINKTCSDGEYLKPGKIQKCCLTPSKCICDRSLCRVPQCGDNQIAFLLNNYVETGACCNEYVCPNSTSASYPPITPTVLCPPDSVWSVGDNECVCSNCYQRPCLDGFERVIKKLSTGLPGGCCEDYQCVPLSNETCLYGDKMFFKGESWFPDNCHTCICYSGHTVCSNSITCSTLNCSLGSQYIPFDSCCPVCSINTSEISTNNITINPITTLNSTIQEVTETTIPVEVEACITENNTIKRKGEVWEAACQSCSCVGKGVVICQQKSCPELHCKLHTYKPGQCCPECTNEETIYSCKLSSGTLLYNNDVIETQINSQNYLACNSCHCNSGDLECGLGPCAEQRDSCNTLKQLPWKDIPSWLEDYGVVVAVNASHTTEAISATCNILRSEVKLREPSLDLEAYSIILIENTNTYFLLVTAARLHPSTTFSQYLLSHDAERTLILALSTQYLTEAIAQTYSLKFFKEKYETQTKQNNNSFTTLILYIFLALISIITIIITSALAVTASYVIIHRRNNCSNSPTLISLSALESAIPANDSNNSRYVEISNKQLSSPLSNVTVVSTTSFRA